MLNILYFLKENKMVSLYDGELFGDTFPHTKRFQNAAVKKVQKADKTSFLLVDLVSFLLSAVPSGMLKAYQPLKINHVLCQNKI